MAVTSIKAAGKKSSWKKKGGDTREEEKLVPVSVCVRSSVEGGSKGFLIVINNTFETREDYK